MASDGDNTIRHFSESALDAIYTVFTSGLDVEAAGQNFKHAGLIPYSSSYKASFFYLTFQLNKLTRR